MNNGQAGDPVERIKVIVLCHHRQPPGSCDGRDPKIVDANSATGLCQVDSKSRPHASRVVSIQSRIVRVADPIHIRNPGIFLRRLSLETVVERIGFAQPSSFTRAFRRWARRLPSAYRAGRD